MSVYMEQYDGVYFDTRNKSTKCIAMGKYLQNNNNVGMEEKPFY